MTTNEKYYSKLLKGFDKMIKRQNSKNDEVVITLRTVIQLPKKFKGEYVHELRVQNSKWNGMNLKVLRYNIFPRRSVAQYNSSFEINKDGKYVLSRAGRIRLNKKRYKQQEQKQSA